MSDEIYTLGAWRVKDGKQSEFVEAWKALGSYFRSLPLPPGEGTLLQSIDDPRQFYSFGPGARSRTSRRCEAGPTRRARSGS